MELRTLRAFVEVVRQGGFSAAGKVVFATQSTVSKAVKQLEDEIGLRLLDRIGHRSTPTAAGEIVYGRALKILAERDDLVAELRELRGLKRGVLRLGIPPIGSSMLFAPLFAAYRRQYPDVEIRLVEHGGDRLEQMLRAGEIELAGALLPVPDEFETLSITNEPFVAILSKEHRLARRKSLDLPALRETPFVLFESGFATSRIILDACRRRGFEPTITARSSQLDFLVELAAVGLGVTFLPRMLAKQRPAAACHVLLAEPRTTFHMAMIWRRGAYLSHAAQAWLALVREAYVKT